MNSLSVSIVVPVYNSGQYLRECLDSLLNQTHKDIEVIVVDDGSTDGSPSICDEYAKKDSRVHVFHIINSGASAARGLGVEHASGEFVFFMDSDDTIDLDTIERALEHVDDGIDIVTMEENEDLVCSPQEFGTRLLSWKAVNLVSKLYRRKLLVDKDIFNIPRDITIAEDLIANVRMLRHLRGNVAVTSLHKYHYRPVSTSLTHSNKVTPEYDIKVMKEVSAAVAAIPFDVHDGFATFRISILKHLVCAGYPFDRDWAHDLKRDSADCRLDLLQRLVLASIDKPMIRPAVRLLVIWKKLLRRMKLR